MPKYRIESNEFGSVVWVKSSGNEDWVFVTEFWGDMHRVNAECEVDYQSRMDQLDNS